LLRRWLLRGRLLRWSLLLELRLTERTLAVRDWLPQESCAARARARTRATLSGEVRAHCGELPHGHPRLAFSLRRQATSCRCSRRCCRRMVHGHELRLLRCELQLVLLGELGHLLQVRGHARATECGARWRLHLPSGA